MSLSRCASFKQFHHTEVCKSLLQFCYGTGVLPLVTHSLRFCNNQFINRTCNIHLMYQALLACLSQNQAGLESEPTTVLHLLGGKHSEDTHCLMEKAPMTCPTDKQGSRSVW